MSVLGQDTDLRQIMHGKRLFWEAQFGQARAVLEKVLSSKDLKPAYRYDSHLILAFTLIRSGEPEALARPHFEAAIKLDLEKKPDPAKYPPDLVADYQQIYDQLVGCVYIDSDPKSDFLIVEGDSIHAKLKTPFRICELVQNNYQLLFSKDGYDKQLLPMPIKAGRTDTVMIKLKKL
jgi:hypothetical protein